MNNLIITIMFLAQALTNIQHIEPRIDRQQVLAETLKNPEKLAKTLLRIEFLTACRRHDLVPRFIEDSLRPVRKIFSSNHRAQNRCETFATALLNEAISDAFRHKAFLERRKTSLQKEVRSFLGGSRLLQVFRTCNQVFDITVRENRPRLVNKFNSLRQKSCIQSDSNSIELNSSTHDEPGNTSVSQSKRVNNLSSLVLDEQKLKVLAKGPNFAITQDISQTVLMEVEKSVERLAYAKRWKDEIRRRKTAQTTTGTVPTEDTRNGGSQPQQEEQHRLCRHQPLGADRQTEPGTVH